MIMILSRFNSCLSARNYDMEDEICSDHLKKYHEITIDIVFNTNKLRESNKGTAILQISILNVNSYRHIIRSMDYKGKVEDQDETLTVTYYFE